MEQLQWRPLISVPVRRAAQVFHVKGVKACRRSIGQYYVPRVLNATKGTQ
jgi:hypothetical protein